MATHDLIGSSEDSELIRFSLQNMRKRYLTELPIFENIIAHILQVFGQHSNHLTQVTDSRVSPKLELYVANKDV